MTRKMILIWCRRIKRNLGWPYRRLTWRYRMLPDFLIVGAMKSGTSSLYACLAQHPQCAPSYIKEIHFFDGGFKQNNRGSFEKGEPWYRAHFPLQTNADNRAFEATPGYIFYPPAAKRIFAANSKMKIIIVLRNPTERAISHYFRNLRQGRESLPIMEALQAEDDWKKSEYITDQEYKNEYFHLLLYKRRGLYAQQIERFLHYFPKQQILILCSEDFFKQPQRTIKQVFEFVGVNAGFEVKNLTPRNVANNKTAVDPEVRQYLNDYFLPHNKALYKLLGQDFGW